MTTMTIDVDSPSLKIASYQANAPLVTDDEDIGYRRSAIILRSPSLWFAPSSWPYIWVWYLKCKSTGLNILVPEAAADNPWFAKPIKGLFRSCCNG
ncbi:hypothetical protein F0562_025453 [Nyssa sinensis]|uniref:Uncharacterized protein n=1 Tax=Nyssa sinensis TaxID=561372 RepID=A0A5J5BGV0_9ASTE|nr:hypothetical protein F0562_025453 [Nyssa sinensis]